MYFRMRVSLPCQQCSDHFYNCSIALSVGDLETSPEVFKIHTTAFDPSPKEAVKTHNTKSSNERMRVNLTLTISSICMLVAFVVTVAMNRVMVSERYHREAPIWSSEASF